MISKSLFKMEHGQLGMTNKATSNHYLRAIVSLVPQMMNLKNNQANNQMMMKMKATTMRMMMTTLKMETKILMRKE